MGAKLIKIYCDGACSGNPGPGGWAYVIPELNIERNGFCPNTTNNRMEIASVIEAISFIKNEYSNIEIITDSQYVVNTMTKGWKKNKNNDLWDYLDSLIKEITIKWSWVKGHNSNQYNEKADQLAVKAYKENN